MSTGVTYSPFRYVLNTPDPQLPCTTNMARPFFGMADFRPLDTSPWIQQTPTYLQCPVVRIVSPVYPMY